MTGIHSALLMFALMMGFAAVLVLLDWLGSRKPR